MHRDFSELLSAFNAHGVEFIVVGAHALAAHGHVRATKDVDVWVRPAPENARRVIRALEGFGAPLQQLTAADLANPGVIFQIGVPPVRVDVLTSIDGVDFDSAWQDRVHAHFGGVPAAVLAVSHLIASKKAAGRLQDLADVEWLEAARRAKPGGES